MKAKKFDDTEKWAKEDDGEKDEKAREEGAFGFRLPFRVFQSQKQPFFSDYVKLQLWRNFPC